MKPIATDIYTFANLIERDCVYVDKTGVLLQLLGDCACRDPRIRFHTSRKDVSWSQGLAQRKDEDCV